MADETKQKLINDDVTNVEFSRLLKRSGYPQASHYYWYADIPTLNKIQDAEAVGVEEKRKMKWLLVDQKPQEPCVSAYTEEELINLFKDKSAVPVITKEKEHFVGSIKGKPLFFNKNKQNIYAQSLIYYLGAR